MKMKICIELFYDSEDLGVADDGMEAHMQAMCDAFTTGDLDFYDLAENASVEIVHPDYLTDLDEQKVNADARGN